MRAVRRLGEIRHQEERGTQADIASPEWNLDRLVYALYGLTEAEIEAVEARVGS